MYKNGPRVSPLCRGPLWLCTISDDVSKWNTIILESDSYRPSVELWINKRSF